MAPSTTTSQRDLVTAPPAAGDDDHVGTSALTPAPEPPSDTELAAGLHLVWASGSAASRRVMMALYEKGLAFQGQLLDASPPPPQPPHVNKAPAAAVAAATTEGRLRRVPDWVLRLSPR
ncbi:hypothetical protein HK405_013977, partial [Cladochytrium tenue]